MPVKNEYRQKLGLIEQFPSKKHGQIMPVKNEYRQKLGSIEQLP